MNVSINQPAYLPWLGYFHRIAISDVHIVLDHVQFEKNSVTNRNKLRTRDGWCWLTVPLKTKGRFSDLSLDRIEIADDPRWRKKHWQSIRQNYSKAPYFSSHSGFFEEVYERDWTCLKDLLYEINTYMLAAFGITTRIQYSSQMNSEGKKDELVFNLCREIGARTYISGPFGRDYLHESVFHEAGMEIVYHDYSHPVYSQVFPAFESHMAAIDLLFNHGSESQSILMNAQEKNLS